ncbi:MAG TPA: hypothetical protein VF593_00115 [Chthoniobacteraceae bacterium]
MNNDFKILIDFLDQMGAEVSGHEFSQPTNEAATRLLKFAKGGCDADERREVCEMLRVHPQWLRWIAGRIIMAREKPSGVGQLA